MTVWTGKGSITAARKKVEHFWLDQIFLSEYAAVSDCGGGTHWTDHESGDPRDPDFDET